MTRFQCSIKLFVLIFSLGIISGCQSDSTDQKEQAQKRLKRGKELLEKGDYVSAELELKSALQKDNTTADSYYYLALLNEKNKNYRSMKHNLTQAVKLSPGNMDARLKLGKALLIFNDIENSSTEINVVLSKRPDSLEALTLKAAVLVRQKKHTEALKILDNVLQKNPQYTEAVSLKALILMENEEIEEALALIGPAIEEDISNIDLQLLKLRIDAKNQDIDAVIGDYKKLVELNPDNDRVKYALAKLYIQANKKHKAEKILRDLVLSKPTLIEPKLVLLEYLNTFESAKVNEQLNRFIAENNKQPAVLLQLCKWMLQKKKFNEAQILLEQIVHSAREANDIQDAKILLARIAFFKKDLKTTTSIIDELLFENPNYLHAKILKAKIHVQQEQYKKAERLLKKVLWDAPNSDEVLVLLAQINLLQGNPKKADRKFREALDINPANLSALIPVIRKSLNNNDLDYATSVLKKALKVNPNNLVLLTNLAKIKIVKREWEAAQAILQAMKKQPQGYIPAKFLQGKIYQEQNECAKAIELFKEILNSSPTQLDTIREMARCYEVLQQRSEMIVYLTSLIEKYPTNIPALLIKSQIYLLDENYNESVSILNKALKINNRVPEIYADLGGIYLKQNNFNEAIASYKRGLEVIPDNIKLSLLLASVYVQSRDYDSALAIYESLLDKYPSLDIAANNVAMLLVERYESVTNLERARELLKRFKNSEKANFIDSYAWVELKMGNINDALALLKKVNVMVPNKAVYKYHLGVAYSKHGDVFSAINELTQAIALGKQKGGFADKQAAQQLLKELRS